MPNSNWGYSLGPYAVVVDTVSGTGTITFTYASGNSGPLGTNATYTPPNGTVPNSNGGNLGAANGTVTNVGWDGTNLSFSYSNYSYGAGVNVPAGPGQTTKFRGSIMLPGAAAALKTWSATK
ncbi:MAG TPA: hypothetical protein VJQ82_05250 [Terriglobales bacterium]|nr:hypothetical protein [Terriglobales bacterium]